VNCPEVQERLSFFYDNRLSPEEAAHVETHVTDCSSCEKELASFGQLSRLAQQLTDPPAPRRLWEELQAKLGAPEEPAVLLTRKLPRSFPSRFLALAATLLIATGIGVLAYQAGNSPNQKHLVVNFAHYLENFSKQPDRAQQVLLAKYDGRPMTLGEATETLGYVPVAAKGLPAGYTVKEVHLLTMPCCTCAQIVCTNESGRSIAIFEHAIDQPVWFGDRPAEECVCYNVPTSIRRVGDQLAATWKEGKRHITMIGATDLDEVTQFVAHFKGTSSG